MPLVRAEPTEKGRTEGAASVRSPRVYTSCVPRNGEQTRRIINLCFVEWDALVGYDDATYP